MKIKLLFHLVKFTQANSSSINVKFQEAKTLGCFPFQGYIFFLTIHVDLSKMFKDSEIKKPKFYLQNLTHL